MFWCFCVIVYKGNKVDVCCICYCQSRVGGNASRPPSHLTFASPDLMKAVPKWSALKKLTQLTTYISHNLNPDLGQSKPLCGYLAVMQFAYKSFSCFKSAALLTHQIHDIVLCIFHLLKFSKTFMAF